jgi:hypothetical protein
MYFFCLLTNHGLEINFTFDNAFFEKYFICDYIICR